MVLNVLFLTLINRQSSPFKNQRKKIIIYSIHPINTFNYNNGTKFKQ
jgi:hypothetical protein